MLNRTLALALLATLSSGCAHDRDWTIKKEGVESTIGNDFNKAPAGQAIKPPGMGVDLGAVFPDAHDTPRA